MHDIVREGSRQEDRVEKCSERHDVKTVTAEVELYPMTDLLVK